MSRAPALLGAAWGAALLLRGPDLMRLLGNQGPSSADIDVIHVLGARQIVEAVALAGLGARVRTPVVLVEAAHAASMAALAGASPTYRRPALVSGAVAGVLGLLTAVRSSRR
ncbi:MAG: hypothetical protein ACRDP1_11680 [Nocardioidaceae bacterium]